MLLQSLWHPVQQQPEEANQGADALFEALVHGCGKELAFQYPEAALDVGQRLVASHYIGA
jgi:hypothetical protein